MTTAPHAAPRTAEPVTTPIEDTATALDKLYHLVLLDDDQHTYAYVIELLGAVFGYGREKAYALASIVDTEGRVILETAGLEQVTRHQQRVHTFGADLRIPTSKGSMSAIIEEAP
jgi:ATP-dependent Clp protease adaptor protein ClpS